MAFQANRAATYFDVKVSTCRLRSQYLDIEVLYARQSESAPPAPKSHPTLPFLAALLRRAARQRASPAGRTCVSEPDSDSTATVILPKRYMLATMQSQSAT